jgi:hypothetical protein
VGGRVGVSRVCVWGGGCRREPVDPKANGCWAVGRAAPPLHGPICTWSAATHNPQQPDTHRDRRRGVFVKVDGAKRAAVVQAADAEDLGARGGVGSGEG